MARREQIPMKAPPGHPFNPLKALRLILAAGNNRETVSLVFRHIWGKGQGIEGEDFDALATSLGIESPVEQLDRDEIKAALRKNTDHALRNGIFGVPTALVNEELFWGLDATEMLLAYLADQTIFEDDEMARIKNFPCWLLDSDCFNFRV